MWAVFFLRPSYTTLNQEKPTANCLKSGKNTSPCFIFFSFIIITGKSYKINKKMWRNKGVRKSEAE